MRNRLLLGLAVAAAAASSVFADSKDFTINKTNTIVNFESGDYDYNIYYSGTANTRARLGIANAEPAKGYTVRSLTLKAGDGSTSQTRRNGICSDASRSIFRPPRANTRF